MLPGFPRQQTSLLVDLSHYFPNADFAAAEAAGVSGVILKATQGGGFRDPAFPSLLARAREAGLLTGAFHFGNAENTGAQLDNFVQTVTAAGGFADVAAALDFESNRAAPGGTMSIAQAAEFVAGFRQRTGHTPMLYAGDWLRERGGALGQPDLAACPLWLAQYGVHGQTLPGWADWTLWQYTDGSAGPYAGQIPGIGRCDQSIFRGTLAELGSFWASLTPLGPVA